MNERGSDREKGKSPTPALPEREGADPTPALPEREGADPTPALPEREGADPTPALPEREGADPTPAFPPDGGEGADPTPALPPVGSEGAMPSARGVGGAVHGLHTANVRIYELLKERARTMRTNPTKAEKVLWRALRGNRTGTYFRRQHVLGNFIVDFVSLDRRLVIEVDGDIHDHQQAEDALRTQWLNQTSFHVLRFRNEEVLLHLNSVLERIETIIQQRPSIGAL